jgi:uncharacterized protein (TIGR03435 family)
MYQIVPLLAALSPCLLAQQPLSFEVASVKVRPPGSLIVAVGASPSGSKLTIEAMSLSDLISWAYNVKPWEVEAGPAWAGTGIRKDRSSLDTTTSRFDIAAKAEGDASRSPEEFRQMSRSLLSDRFQLAMHRETRETPVYALVIDKNGPKFRESGADARGVMRMNGRGKVTASGGTMAQLVAWFSNANGVDRPIVDQTGLAGHYDFTVEWSNPLAGDSLDSSAPSIFAAMREQLGLRLEPRRAPLEVFVIDHAEMPSSN